MTGGGARPARREQDELSRRRVLRAGVASGASALLAMLLGACGSGATAKRSEGADLYGQAAEERVADAFLLGSALELELRLAAVYAAVAPVVSGPARALVQRIAGHEQAHAAALRSIISGLIGHQRTAAPAAVSFATPRSRTEALRLAIREENRAIAFYIDALPKLSTDNKQRSPLAAIMTTEAEHLALLSLALGEPGAPQSIVRGQA